MEDTNLRDQEFLYNDERNSVPTLKPFQVVPHRFWEQDGTDRRASVHGGDMKFQQETIHPNDARYPDALELFAKD